MALKQNIIYIYFKGKHSITSKSQYQYNHGQFLYFADLNLPQAFEVHFSNENKGYSKTKVGGNKLVEIPDEYFWSDALQIYAWVYLHSDTDDGETMYEVKIPLIKRAKPTDEEPLPQQESAMERAIAELNNAVEITTGNANKTEEDKTQVGIIRDEVVDLKESIYATAENVAQKSQDAIDASRRSETSAQNAAEFEEGAHNYSESARQSAQEALESKTIAKQKADIATQASDEALGYRDESVNAKDVAVQAKQDTVDYRDETKGYRDETLTVKNNVQTLKNQIDETAEEIEDISNAVKEDAQSASQSASSASQSANQAEHFKNQSETNVTHYPKVVYGYWYVWDASNEEWVNTNIDASGEDGISPTVTITNNETQGTHFIKITDKDGYKTATISDGLTVVMSPSSFVIPTDENGILINNVPLKVTFRAYRAKTPLTLSITNAETITLINPYATEIKGVIWGYTASSTEPYVNATLPSGYKLQGGDSGKFEFTVKVDDKSIVLNSTWALAKRGEHGESGVYIGTEPPTDEDIDVWIDSDGTADDIVTDVQIDGVSVVVNGIANLSAPLKYIKDDPSDNGGVIEGDIDANVASGRYSHAEGSMTEASGQLTHAEGGGSKATGICSHAEGGGTLASGRQSHSEGYYTTASGDNSHAEGRSAISSGVYSHAEGLVTIANHRSQHVFGEYNAEDSSISDASKRGDYIEIVGNGNNNARSNARTLDWNGNEKLAGSLTLGMDTQDEISISASELKELKEINPVNDVQINGTSIVQNGVANVPIANNTLGAISISTNVGETGLIINQYGVVSLYPSITAFTKAGANVKLPITPSNQHEAVFYGLAKASGDSTQASSSNPVGTYTEDAKTAIRTMLGLEEVYQDYSSALTALGVI